MKTQTKDPAAFDFAEFQTLLRIDRHNLDEEVERQPELYYKIAAEEARVRSRFDASKNALELVTANIDGEIRSKALKNDEKITEAVVRAKISQDKRCVQATEDQLKLKRRLDLLTALKDSFRQRSYMLRDLVELYTSGYYTDATIRGHSDRAKEKHAEKNQERMSQRRREHL